MKQALHNPGHGVTPPTGAPALPTPAVKTIEIGGDVAGQGRPTRFDALPGHDVTEAVQAGEGRQIRGSEGSQSDHYTVIIEEP